MAITKVSPDVVNFDSALVVSPTLTIGDATAEDTKIVFDGNAQDYYIGLDDSADDLVIGLGSAVGTTPAIVIDENLNVGIGVTPSSNLHVKGTGETQIYIDAAASNNPGIRLLENGTNKWTIGNDQSNDSLFFYDFGASATRVAIDSAGTLRVGNPAGIPTPGSGWDANLDAIQVGEASAFRSGDSDYSAATVVSTNLYQTGGGDKLLNGTDFAAQYAQQGGNHYFYGYNNGSADATPAVDANDLANPVIIHKGGGLSIGGGSVANTANGKAGIFWHGNPQNGGDYCIRRTNDAWSGSNYAQLLIDWDTGVKIDVGNSAYGKSYLEVNGNVKFTAAGQGIDFSATANEGNVYSELFDDYEEGHIEPTVTGSASGTYTLSSTGNSYAYTKIGQRVFISGYLTITGGSGTGQLRVSMPFTAATMTDDQGYSFGSGLVQNNGSSITGQKYAFVSDAATYFDFYHVNDAGSAQGLPCGSLDTSFQIGFDFSFIAA